MCVRCCVWVEGESEVEELRLNGDSSHMLLLFFLLICLCSWQAVLCCRSGGGGGGGGINSALQSPEEKKRGNSNFTTINLPLLYTAVAEVRRLSRHCQREQTNADTATTATV